MWCPRQCQTDTTNMSLPSVMRPPGMAFRTVYNPSSYSCVPDCKHAWRTPHLMRTVPREALATHGRSSVLDLPQGVGEYGAAMEGLDMACSAG